MKRGGEQPGASGNAGGRGAPSASGAAVPAAPGSCIILAGTEASVPVELLAGLSRRGMAVRVVTDAPSVMVHLAREPAAALLLAAGTQLPGHDDLLRAVRRYHPNTGCWEYIRTDAGIRVTKLVPPPERAPDAPTAAGAGSTRRNGSASPAVNGKPRTLDDLVMHVPGSDLAPHEPLVTEEELAMLLGTRE